MAVKEIVLEFVERYLSIENERKLLADDQKQLVAEFKEKLDVKAVKAAIQIAKIRSKLAETTDTELENILETVESRLTIDYAD